jgi:NAD(P)-dependent dehydrogenase (short-subunit alcohol dehydrogenase family)
MPADPQVILITGASSGFGRLTAHTLARAGHVVAANVLGTQRVNRAALPHLRAQGSGLLLWVGSSSTRGGHPPFLAPYFAAKAGMDALAESYAGELIRFGIGTTIVIPGAFTSGTNHFAHAGRPQDTQREAAYDTRYGQLRSQIDQRLAALIPPDADAQSVADEIARVVALPAHQRPFRTHVDPSRDGSEVVSAVADRIRAEFYHRLGIEDLLSSNAAL